MPPAPARPFFPASARKKPSTRAANFEAARRRGKHLGRAPADLTPEKITHARQIIYSGDQSVTGMAKIIGVHRVTLHKALKRTAGR